MRVLRVLTRPNVGGPMRQAVALWHAHRSMGVATLLVVGDCGAGEASVDLSATGIPRWDGSSSGGLLRIPELRRSIHPWRDAVARRALRAAMVRFVPDVVHTHTSKAGWLGRRAAAAACVPVVAHTYHGHVLRDYFSAPVNAVVRSIERRAARRTDLRFAVSPSCAAELAEFGVAETEVLPPAVDTRAFAESSRREARARLGLDNGEAAVGFAGRLVPIKRPEWFAQLVGSLPGVRGHVFGDGPLRDRIRDLGGERLVLWGATEDLASLLGGLDVLVLPSRREGCPLVAIEAFAAGVPVVGFDVPGVRDVLETWGAGILVPEAAGVPGLAAAVRGVLDDDARRAAIVEAARGGLDRFAPASVGAAMVAAYRRAAKRRPDGATLPA